MDAARGMVERGDCLVPRYQGQPFFDKPALTYWLMAAGFRAFGFTPGAARLVPPAAALALRRWPPSGWARCSSTAARRRRGGARAGHHAPVPELRPRGHVGHAAHAVVARWPWPSARPRPTSAGRTVPAHGRARAPSWASGSSPRARSPCCSPGLGLLLLAVQRRRGAALPLTPRPPGRWPPPAFAVVRARLVRRRLPGAWAPSRSRTSSCARTWSASRARPTTPAARPSTTSAPTWRPACPGRCCSRWRPCAAARRRRASCCSGWRSWPCPSACRAARSTTTCCRCFPPRRWSSGATSRRPWDRSTAPGRGRPCSRSPCSRSCSAGPAGRRMPAEWLPGLAAPGRAHRRSVATVSAGRGRWPRRGPRPAAWPPSSRAAPRPASPCWPAVVPARLPRRAAQRGRGRRRAPRARLPARRRARRLRRPRAGRAATSCSRRASWPRGALRPVGSRRPRAVRSCSSWARRRRGRWSRCPACARSRLYRCAARRRPHASGDPRRPARRSGRAGRQLRDRRSGGGGQAAQGPEAGAARRRPPMKRPARALAAGAQALSSRKISAAARTVASMSLSVWASDTNAASNWAGGK